MDTLTNFFYALGPTVLNNLDLIGVYVILALGLNLINGLGGMFSLGHAGFWAIGAYTSAALTIHNPFGLPVWLNFGIAIVLAIIFAGVAGLAIALPCLRLAGDYLAIATLGFGIIIVTILYNIDFLGAATGLTGIPVLAPSWFIWIMVALTLIFCYRVQFSKLGRTIEAVREDEIAAQSIGINRFRNKTMVFVLGAGVAGLAGAMYANSATYLNPSGFEFDQSVKVLTMVVLGGLGSITGVTIAAIALTLLPEFLRLFNLSDYQMLVFSVILIIMVLTRPEGILAGHEVWELKRLRGAWDPSGLKAWRLRHPASTDAAKATSVEKRKATT